MATVEFLGENVVFASDVQGPVCDSTLETILAKKPKLVMLGGPPTYLSGFRVKPEHIQRGMQNLTKLVERVPTTIVGHHVLRDENWEKELQQVFDAASKSGNKVFTAAEYTGQQNNFLEFKRKQLFDGEPPDSDFKAWMKLPLQKRKLTKPPI
jgi:predicted metallo-beta-lactamase superfamily hydrolase